MAKTHLTELLAAIHPLVQPVQWKWSEQSSSVFFHVT